tara:strand:+ start:699 stop:1073 length:375 start_codon:yes stop_codon:yes gene_type:complete
MKNKTLNLLLIITIVFITSCNSDDDNEETNDSFNVTVLREGNKCGIVDDITGTLDYLIEFDQNATDLPVSNQTIYYAANLPENYRTENLQINITFREINENEEAICATVIGGDEYPFIYILTAN